MTRTLSTTLKAVLLAGLAVMFCTKLPSDMDKLVVNIGSTSLVFPADGSTDNILSPSLCWQSVSGATGYRVEVSTSSDFSAIEYSDTAVIDTITAAAGLKYKTIYYWRVQVHDAASSSDWSEHRIFTTIVEPQLPVAALPKDSLKDATTTVTLTWRSASGAASYFVEVATDTAFRAIVAADSTLADTAKVINSLVNNTVYYWRVRSQNPGGASAWTTTRTFTTIIAAPKAPVLSLPSNGALDQQLSLTLVWGKITEASGYYLQVATDIAFTNVFAQDSSLIDTTRVITGCANTVTYYWRVKAKNDGGASAWSLVSGFTTFSAVPQQPLLSLPADNAASQTIPLTLVWNKAVGSAAYHLQVAADSAFSQVAFIDSTLTDTSKSVGGLANSTKYFWRVRAKNPTGVSAWSLVRGFTTFSATLGTPVLRSPADGSTAQSTAPALGWQSVTGATKYRIQVSVSSDFSTIFFQDSGLTDTSRTLAAGASLTNSTMYYWRVRAENASGLSNWASPWRFTTVMAAPQVPLLVSPPDGSTGQQLSLTLTWNKATGAATYILQVSSDSGFATIVAGDTALADTAKPIGVPLNNKTYYWRVGSKNAVGTSGWSVRRSFTTFDALLSVPALQSPQDGTRDVLLTQALSWSVVANASTYEVQVSTTRDFTNVVIDDATLTAGSKTPNAGVLANSTTYYWKVMARNLSGTSNWTDAWSFTTVITTPATPAPLAPADNAANQPVSLSLTWNKATGAATYYVQVASDTAFAAVVIRDSTLTDTTKAVSGLSNSTAYYWKVKARNASGDGTWSAYRNFTTIIAAPTVPVLTSPVKAAANVDISPQLAWTAVTGAGQYHIQVSTAADYTTGLVVDDSTYTQATKLIGPLLRNTVYFWHVRAKNAGGASAWSDTGRFTTIPAAPGAPNLLAPADASTDQPLSQTFTWNRSTGASMYYVSVATDTGFTANVKTDSTSAATDTSKTIAGLANAATYYWHVEARNPGGSALSGRRSFATVPAAPNAPVLVSPADAATAQPVSLTLVWNKSGGATRYDVTVATDAGFTVVFKADSTLSLTDTSIVISGLAGGVTYFWEVQAKNAAGPGAVSGRRSFTTIPQFAISITAVNGSVTKSPNQAKYDSGSVVSLIPAAAANYHFTGWSGDLTGTTNPGNITVNAPKNVTATFALDSPSTPALVSPADGVTRQPDSMTLTWNKVTLASVYYVNVSTDAGFSTIVKIDSTVSPTDTSKVITGLSGSTTFYWRVQAKNATAASAWSEVRSYGTITQFALFITGTNGTVTRSPNQLQYDSGTVVTLSASPSGGSYQFAGWSGDLSGSLNPATITMNAPKNVTASFVAPPAAPVLVAPFSNQTNMSIKPLLTWKKVSGASQYEVSVSPVKSFSSTIVDSTTADTSKQCKPLSASTKYYWRVIASNAAGTNQTIDSFTTTWVSWTAKNTGLSNKEVERALLRGNELYASTADGPYKSLDSGETWNPANSGMSGMIVLGMGAQGSNLFAATNGHGMWLSKDSGTTWTAVNNGLDTGYAYFDAVSVGKYVFAAVDGGGVFVSADTGKSWTAANNGISGNATMVHHMAVLDTTVFIGTYSGVYYSSDKGASWNAANSGLTSTNVYSLVAIGTDLYCGASNGTVYMSANHGASWTPLNSGQSLKTNAAGTGFALSGTNLFAGTYMTGVYLSTDNGTTFSQVSDGLPATPYVMTLVLMGNRLFAIGYNGAFMTTVP